MHDQDYTIYPLTDLDVKRVYHKGDKVAPRPCMSGEEG